MRIESMEERMNTVVKKFEIPVWLSHRIFNLNFRVSQFESSFMPMTDSDATCSEKLRHELRFTIPTI